MFIQGDVENFTQNLKMIINKLITQLYFINLLSKNGKVYINCEIYNKIYKTKGFGWYFSIIYSKFLEITGIHFSENSPVGVGAYLRSVQFNCTDF